MHILEPIIPTELQDSLNDYLQQLHDLIEADELLEPLLDATEGD